MVHVWKSNFGLSFLFFFFFFLAEANGRTAIGFSWSGLLNRVQDFAFLQTTRRLQDSWKEMWVPFVKETGESLIERQKCNGDYKKADCQGFCTLLTLHRPILYKKKKKEQSYGIANCFINRRPFIFCVTTCVYSLVRRIGFLQSAYAPELHAYSDAREPISLHQSVFENLMNSAFKQTKLGRTRRENLALLFKTALGTNMLSKMDWSHGVCPVNG